jgi:hypothetical protein
VEHRLTLEYRRLRRLPTCIGNERIRITREGQLSHSRNVVECETGSDWSAPWRTVGTLDDRAMARLAQEIVDTGILELPLESSDESAEGGSREELDLSIHGRELHFVAENTAPPQLHAVTKLLWAAFFDLDR